MDFHVQLFHCYDIFDISCILILYVQIRITWFNLYLDILQVFLGIHYLNTLDIINLLM